MPRQAPSSQAKVRAKPSTVKAGSAKAKTSKAKAAKASSPPLSRDDQLARAALQLAAKHPWSDVTLEDLAHAAGLPFASVQAAFPDLEAVPPAVVQFITRESEKAFSSPPDLPDEELSPRDLLGDLLMTRFDVLQTHRAGILGLTRALQAEPPLVADVVQAQIHAVRSLLAHANVLSPVPWKGFVQTLGFWALYVAVFRRWCSDETPDLAPTLATLDRVLHHAEPFAHALAPTGIEPECCSAKKT